MAIEAFTWCPRLDAAADVNFRVRKAQFGDGYTQVSGDGPNPKSLQWELSFVGSEAYVQAIKEFLDRHEGRRAFQWKPPLEPLGLYRCETYKPTALGGKAGNKQFSLSATFIQAYAP